MSLKHELRYSSTGARMQTRCPCTCSLVEKFPTRKSGCRQTLLANTQRSSYAAAGRSWLPKISRANFLPRRLKIPAKYQGRVRKWHKPTHGRAEAHEDQLHEFVSRPKPFFMCKCMYVQLRGECAYSICRSMTLCIRAGIRKMNVGKCIKLLTSEKVDICHDIIIWCTPKDYSYTNMRCLITLKCRVKQIYWFL